MKKGEGMLRRERGSLMLRMAVFGTEYYILPLFYYEIMRLMFNYLPFNCFN